jgi:carbon monoxide dehydrogenase subunit G
MDFSNTVTIDRPRHEVFSFLADLENIPKWNYAIVETRKLSDGPVGVGATFRQVRSVPSPREESLQVVGFEPDRHLAIRGDLGPFSGTLAYDLEEVGGRTQVTNTAHLEGRGLMKAAAPLAAGRVSNAVAANLGALKELLEGR